MRETTGFLLNTKTQQAQLSLGHQAILPPSPSRKLQCASKELLGQCVNLQPLWFAAFWCLDADAQSFLGSAGAFLTLCVLPLQCQNNLIFQCPSKLLPAPGGVLSPSPPAQDLALLLARFGCSETRHCISLSFI